MVWREIALLHDHGAERDGGDPRGDERRRRGCSGSIARSAPSNRASAPISLLVEGDPLADLAGWRAPSSVMQGGRIVA